MHFGDDVAHLNLLAVAPNRRQGSVAAHGLAHGHRHGGRGVSHQSRIAHDNDGARIFYARLGSINVVQGYYQGREAALRMSRRLP